MKNISTLKPDCFHLLSISIVKALSSFQYDSGFDFETTITIGCWILHLCLRLVLDKSNGSQRSIFYHQNLMRNKFINNIITTIESALLLAFSLPCEYIRYSYSEISPCVSCVNDSNSVGGSLIVGFFPLRHSRRVLLRFRIYYQRGVHLARY